MSSEEYISPPLFSILSALFTLSAATFFGRIRDVLYFLFHPFDRRVKKGFAPLRDPTEDFYMRRMYGRIVDCWNRPICSAPDAHVMVMERRREKDTTGTRHAEIVPTGRQIECLNLSSYNYLGFAAFDPYCTHRVVDTIKEFGVSTCSARVQAGTTSVHTRLEELVAEYIGVEDAVTYGMGFATNSSTIPALVGKGCLVLSDALNHSSIVAGIRLSGAKVKVFRHNDAGHLAKVMRLAIAEGQPRSHRPWKKILVIVEGVYSMEGETCNLKEIVQIAKAHKAYVYLDEAHSIGALGPTGRGCCEHWGVDPKDVDIMMGTFTKSFGSCGGYIAGKREIIDYLRRHSPAHLYACSIAPGCAQQIISALEVMMGLDGTSRGQDKIKQLHDNANYMRSRLLTMGLDVIGSWDSPVMPIMTYSAAKMVALSRICLKEGLAMVIVGFPATPVLLTRTRICISAAHTREDLDKALIKLEEVCDLCMLRFRNKGLYKRLEQDLKDYVERFFGPELAAKATIQALADGSFELPTWRAHDSSGAAQRLKTAEDKRAAQEITTNGSVNNHQQQLSKRPRTAASVTTSTGTKMAQPQTSVLTPLNGTRHKKALASVQAHAKAVVTPK